MTKLELAKKLAEKYWKEQLDLKEYKDYLFYYGCSYTIDNIRGTQCSVMGGEYLCTLGEMFRSGRFGLINEAYITKFMEAYS